MHVILSYSLGSFSFEGEIHLHASHLVILRLCFLSCLLLAAAAAHRVRWQRSRWLVPACPLSAVRLRTLISTTTVSLPAALLDQPLLAASAPLLVAGRDGGTAPLTARATPSLLQGFRGRGLDVSGLWWLLADWSRLGASR